MSAGEMGLSFIEADTTTIGDGHTISTYLASAGSGFLTSTTVGSDEALDVYLSGLSKTEDTAHAGDSEGLQIFAVRQDTLATLVSADGDLSMLSVNASGALYCEVTSSALPTGAATETTLAALDTKIGALSKTEDAAHASGTDGLQVFAVRQDTLGTLVDTDGDLSMLSVNASGALYTTTSISSLSGQYAEDSVASTGDIGNFQLAVRRDTSGSNAADGDYTEMQTWLDGSLRTVDHANNVNLQQIVTVGTTATQLPASNLAGRKLIMIQNVSDKKIYLGSSTVTADETATGGVQLGRGGFVTCEAGPDNDLYGRAGTAGNAVAVWEFS